MKTYLSPCILTLTLASLTSPAIGCGGGGQTSASATDSDSEATSDSDTSSETEPTTAGPTTTTPTTSDSEAGTMTDSDSSSSDTDSSQTDTETTETTEDPTTDTGTESDTTDPSESESDTDPTDSGTDTDIDPSSCLDIDLPYEGPLCGPEQDPCQVLRDEFVSPDQNFRNDSPAIALDSSCSPHVLYSVAVGGYHGFYAQRTGVDTWETEDTPMDVATCGLTIDPADDSAVAQVDDGAFGVSLWRRIDGQWSELASQNSMNHSRAQGLGRDTTGNLHTAMWSAAGEPRIGTYTDSWNFLTAVGSQAQDVALGVDELNASGHMTYWTSIEGTWELYWEAPPEPPELVAPLVSNVLEVREQALTVIPPMGLDLPTQPWVLLADRTAPQGHHKILLASREGVKDWNVREVAAEDPDSDQTCFQEPNGPGDSCNYDYIRYQPLEIVSSHGGDVRFLYLQLNHKGTLVAECVDMPFPMCFWTLDSDESTSELRVGWPTEDGVGEAVVAQDVFPTRMTAVLDSGGNIHIAYYDRPPTMGDPTVRYLAIGSGN